jgi:hypothetical protein
MTFAAANILEMLREHSCGDFEHNRPQLVERCESSEQRRTKPKAAAVVGERRRHDETRRTPSAATTARRRRRCVDGVDGTHQRTIDDVERDAVIGAQFALVDADVTRRDAKQHAVARRIQLRIEAIVGANRCEAMCDVRRVGDAVRWRAAGRQRRRQSRHIKVVGIRCAIGNQRTTTTLPKITTNSRGKK